MYYLVKGKRSSNRYLIKAQTKIGLLDNWRPISLLNTDYKIATKTVAARIAKVLLAALYTRIRRDTSKAALLVKTCV